MDNNCFNYDKGMCEVDGTECPNTCECNGCECQEDCRNDFMSKADELYERSRENGTDNK